MQTTDKTLTYPFSEEEFQRAAEEWGCNCGPSALAFALQIPLDRVRHAIPGFESKRYTSPTMMKAALANLNVTWSPERILSARYTHADDHTSLVRIQWTGPWTAPGANPKWAYRQTHWISTFTSAHGAKLVFDCNGGMMGLQRWIDEIVPFIVKHVPRADGDWFPTHVWKIVWPCGGSYT